MQEIKIKKTVNKKKIVIISVIIAIVLIFIGTAVYAISKGSQIFDKNSDGGSPFFNKTGEVKGEGDGRINILAMGMGGSSHPGGTLTDSMMVISINPKDKSMAMLSIPRDLYVPIPDHNISTKINEAYSIGERDKKGSGPTLVKKTVGNILDLPIHYYLTIDFKGFEKIVNSLGGVDVNVEKAIYDSEYPDDSMTGYAPFSIKAGPQHLDGKTALKYARSRHGTSGGDFDRSARQQQILKAMKEKALSAGFLANPKKIIDAISAVGDSVRTDFSVNEMKQFFTIIKNIDSGKIISKVLSTGSDGMLVSDSSSGTYYLRPKDGTFEDVKRLAHEIFTDPNLADENATIDVLNGTKQASLASKLAIDLKSYGYRVDTVDTSKDTYKKTTIIDYSNNTKKTTLQFLKSRLGAEIIKRDKTAGTSSDITIIIGDDYKGFTSKNI